MSSRWRNSKMLISPQRQPTANLPKNKMKSPIPLMVATWRVFDMRAFHACGRKHIHYSFLASCSENWVRYAKSGCGRGMYTYNACGRTEIDAFNGWKYQWEMYIFKIHIFIFIYMRTSDISYQWPCRHYGSSSEGISPKTRNSKCSTSAHSQHILIPCRCPSSF